MPPLKREVLARLPNARYQPRPKAVGCMPMLGCSRLSPVSTTTFHAIHWRCLTHIA